MILLGIEFELALRVLSQLHLVALKSAGLRSHPSPRAPMRLGSQHEGCHRAAVNRDGVSFATLELEIHLEGRHDLIHDHHDHRAARVPESHRLHPRAVWIVVVSVSGNPYCMFFDELGELSKSVEVLRFLVCPRSTVHLDDATALPAPPWVAHVIIHAAAEDPGEHSGCPILQRANNKIGQIEEAFASAKVEPALCHVLGDIRILLVERGQSSPVHVRRVTVPSYRVHCAGWGVVEHVLRVLGLISVVVVGPNFCVETMLVQLSAGEVR
mmetsp:Transcript_12026/g.21370  ORF Transcript_12026/g.21370 Transcript_12026/m.21370 type:complete len:269 (-) Transcript_12026:145-951(-)